MTDQPAAKKSLGQHWLKDRFALEAMVTAADLKTGDTVLEIGPGLGSLTELLLDKPIAVVALELDDQLVARLDQKFKQPLLKIEQGDIRSYDLNKLPVGYKIVANIPYYLTAYLLRLLTETSNPPKQAVLLVQKEVAERIVARPGQMSQLSVFVQLEFEVFSGQVVAAKLFDPPPKVDSKILILKKRPSPLFKNIDRDQLTRLIKTGFSQPRKTLANNLSSGLQKERLLIKQLLAKLNLGLKIRAQELSLPDWHKLYKAIFS